VLTIKRDSEVLIPSADTVIEQNDIAFVLGESKDIQKSFRL
jgi:trk system potassium uptake protein TrkA